MGPPSGFLWVAAVWVVALVIANAAFLTRYGLDTWPRAIMAGIETALMFALLVAGIALALSNLTTGPLPVPWWGGEPCYGIGWNGASIGAFCFWNVICLLLLRRSARVHVADDYRLLLPDRRRLLRLNTIVYLAGLVPFVLSGALLHGWTGGHLYAACLSRLLGLGDAIVQYADEHGNRLPSGTDMQAVSAELVPYMRPDGPSYGARRDGPSVCPARAIFERHPRLYIWNASVSGKSLEELRALPGETPVISCDFGEPMGAEHSWRLTVRDLLQRAPTHPDDP